MLFHGFVRFSCMEIDELLNKKMQLAAGVHFHICTIKKQKKTHTHRSQLVVSPCQFLRYLVRTLLTQEHAAFGYIVEGDYLFCHNNKES